MHIGLRVFECHDDANDRSRRNFRFAVVNFSKSTSYPQNFVCMLPSQFGKGKTDCAFSKLFGDKSLEQAKVLLKAAWELEDDYEVRVEIERRLRLLEHKETDPVKCSSCGKYFQPQQKKRLKKNFCGECIKKKFGSQV